MHPYQHVFLHRGPSRVFWFLFGAGAATWWHYASVRDHHAQYFPCLTHRRRLQEPPASASDQEPAPWGSQWGQQRDWERDRERLRHLQQRAGETAADLSESTLDSIISGAESLKAKLAQLRAERGRLDAEKNAAPPAV